MKDATLTIRLPSATRARIEALAAAEGRSLSQQVERLIELGFGLADHVAEARRPYGRRPLAGALRGRLVPTLDDFRAARGELDRALAARTRTEAAPSGDGGPADETPRR